MADPTIIDLTTLTAADVDSAVQLEQIEHLLPARGAAWVSVDVGIVADPTRLGFGIGVPGLDPPAVIFHTTDLGVTVGLITKASERWRLSLGLVDPTGAGIALIAALRGIRLARPLDIVKVSAA